MSTPAERFAASASRAVIPMNNPMIASPPSSIISATGESGAAGSPGDTTGATTSGRVSNVTVTAATAGNTLNGYDGFKMAYAVLGRAMSARTTGETTAGTDLLVDWAINLFGR